MAWLPLTSALCAALVSSSAALKAAGAAGLHRRLQDLDDVPPEWFVGRCHHKESPLVPHQDQLRDSNKVHVVYASSVKGFEQLFASAASLLAHLPDPRSCVIHVIVPEKDMDVARQLMGCLPEELALREGPASSSSGSPTVDLLAERPLNFDFDSTLRTRGLSFKEASSGFMSTLSVSRLLLHEYLPPEEVQRVLWLDIDTIVRSDITPLYQMRMEHAFAAVPNSHLDFDWTVAKEGFRHIANQEDVRPEKYFNTGVLLIDLEGWRRRGAGYNVTGWGRRLRWAYADEVALNFAFKDRYDSIDGRWNLAALGSDYELPRQCAEEGHVLHFNAGMKCWRPGCTLGRNGHHYENPRSQCAVKLVAQLPTWCNEPGWCNKDAAPSAGPAAASSPRGRTHYRM